MRSTLTLDPDIDAAIREIHLASGRSSKEIINSALRKGFASKEAICSSPKLTIRPLSMGLNPGVSLVSISELESMMETTCSYDAR